MISLNLRTKISLLSAVSMGVILIILYILITVFYSNNMLQRLDNTLLEDAQVVKRILRFNQQGVLDLYNQPDEASQAFAYQGKIYYLIRNHALQPVRRSANMTLIELPKPAFQNKLMHYFSSIDFAGKRYRLLNMRYEKSRHAGREDLTIQTIRPLANYQQERQALIYAMLQLAPIPIVLVAIGGWWIAGRALRPVNTLINTVNGIGADDLATRVTLSGKDEVGRLATSFNIFLDRLEKAFNALRRFTADASHELRTPLTSMRAQGEVALTRSREKREYRDIIGSMLEEIDRLEQLTDSLLQFARSDAGILKINLRTANLSSLLLLWLERLTPLLEEKHITVERNIEDNISLDIDDVIFERIIVNLIENAIQYTPEHEKIYIELHQQGNTVRIQICDSGPGISDQCKEIIFERFVRLDATRHVARGAGLGLAIVKWAVDIHNGHISVHDNKPKGACFTLVFN